MVVSNPWRVSWVSPRSIWTVIRFHRFGRGKRAVWLAWDWRRFAQNTDLTWALDNDPALLWWAEVVIDAVRLGAAPGIPLLIVTEGAEPCGTSELSNRTSTEWPTRC